MRETAGKLQLQTDVICLNFLSIFNMCQVSRFYKRKNKMRQ